MFEYVHHKKQISTKLFLLLTSCLGSGDYSNTIQLYSCICQPLIPEFLIALSLSLIS